MTDYLDIGVVQIQSWLARTPKLRGRRGGSTLISQASDPATIGALLQDFGSAVRINDEAGRIDGVVSLQLLDSAVQPEVERRVIAHLRGHMPGAALSVKWFNGANYSRARTDGTIMTAEWPAAAADWPPGRPCDWCSTWPARPFGRKEKDHEVALCAECEGRDEAAGRAERREKRPFPETKLLAELGSGDAEVPDDFPALSKLDGPKQTHLALVYADGNAIGKFIQELQRTGAGQTDFASAIDNATWGALVAAVNRIRRDGDARLPIIPHLVGGDDVLVSIPPSRAWRFAETLLQEFTRRVGAETGNEAADWLPTLSAGVVFHHLKVPLFQLNELAKTLLRRAKNHTYGEAAALAWHDTTQDGRELTTRSPLSQDVFVAHRDALDSLARQPNSARQRLDELLRAHGPDSGQLAAHAARIESSTVLAAFGDSIELADALGMVRWWWHEPA